jgi:basic amino acid/polyamine antiporter, APA family
LSTARQLSLFDVVCLGVNAIVGAGIYVFPGSLAMLLGPVSFFAFGLCGVVAALVGLCFAEAAGMFDRSGGPYLYARAALGQSVGYLVGWTCWVAAVLSWAAVARAIPPYLSRLWPAMDHSSLELAVPILIVVTLGGVNVLGLKPGAILTDFLTVAKLLPLLLLVGLGTVRQRRSLITPLAPHGLGSLPKAAFSVFFAYQGFEVVPVPAGETAHPRRNAPAAVLGSLGISTLLYMLIQWMAVATTPGLAGSDQPLAEMGLVLLGQLGASLVAIAAVISMLGFCAGVALAGPRYVEALAQDGLFPASIAVRHARFATPHRAILLTTGFTVVLIFFLEFKSLIDLSVLTVSIQYLSTSLAVLLLRFLQPDLPRSFRLPGGPVIPLLAMGVTLYLGAQARPQELIVCLLIWAAGLLPRLAMRLFQRVKTR